MTEVRRQSNEPFQRNPFDVERTTTDKFFIPFLGAAFLTWLGILIYASRTNVLPGEGSILPDSVSEIITKNSYEEYKRVSELTRVYFTLSPTPAVIGIILVFLSVSGLLRVVRWKSEGWSSLSLVLIIAYAIIILIENLTMLLMDDVNSIDDLMWTSKYPVHEKYEILPNDGQSDLPTNLVRSYHTIEHSRRVSDDESEARNNRIVLLVKNFVLILYAFTALCCMFEVSLSKIESVFKEIFRIFFFFYRLSYLSMAIFALQMIILYRSGSAYLKLSESNILAYIALVIGMYLNNVLLHYLVMVTSQLTATWHWSFDAAKNRGAITRKSIFSILRYHLGTIACNATIIVPAILALFVMVFKNSKTRAVGRPKGFASVEFMFNLFLMTKMMNYSSSVTAIKGDNSLQATYSTYQTFSKNSKLALTFTFTFRVTIVLITFCITQMSGLPFLFANIFFIDIHTLGLLSYHFYGLVLLPYFAVLNSIERANLFCTLENDDQEESAATQQQNGEQNGIHMIGFNVS